MHDVAVTFDGHDVADLHAAVAGDPANVVAAQIDEHDVLGPFLGIGDQFLGQARVFFLGQPAATRAGERADRDPVLRPGP